MGLSVVDQSGNRPFEHVVLPHLDAAYRLALWLLRNPTDAEDAVQDALLRALRSFAACRPETARPWLLRIVRHHCYDRLQTRRDRSMPGFADIDRDDASGDQFTTDAFTGAVKDPLTLLLDDDRQALLRRLIAALPTVFREVLVLRDIEDLSYREIASIVDIPIGTVMSRLARARTMIIEEGRRRDGRD